MSANAHGRQETFCGNSLSVSGATETVAAFGLDFKLFNNASYGVNSNYHLSHLEYNGVHLEKIETAIKNAAVSLKNVVSVSLSNAAAHIIM